jgi:hypothetical protein
MISVVCPTYLPNVIYFAWICSQKKVSFVSNSHFQKQTFRSRTTIYGANGKLNLTIPIVHKKGKGCLLENKIEIAYDEAWQKQHWNSLCSSYGSSPYFEYYETDYYSFYHEKITHLFSLNLKLIKKTMELLEIPFHYNIVEWDDQKMERLDDLINSKNTPQINQTRYNQVFECKKGFIPNLNILDVLFNLGPNASDYIKKANYKP